MGLRGEEYGQGGSCSSRVCGSDRKEYRQVEERTHHIDEDIERITLPFLDQLGGIVLGPFGLVVQVTRESFLAPGTFARVRDRGVGGDRFIFPRVLQELISSDDPPQVSLVFILRPFATPLCAFSTTHASDDDGEKGGGSWLTNVKAP